MIISISSQKGGTGKTTSAINIGAGLVRHGQSVLLIDLDPQANLSQSLGIIEPENTVEDFLLGTSFGEVVTTRENLKVIPSNMYFSENKVETPFMLKDALEETPEFDYIIIDSPPHLGILTINSLVVATDIFTTVQCDFLSFLSLKRLEIIIAKIGQNIDRKLRLSGIIPTFYYSNTVLSNDILKRLKKNYKKIVFQPVRKNVSLSECPISKKSIFAYDPKSHGAKDYEKITKKILRR